MENTTKNSFIEIIEQQEQEIDKLKKQLKEKKEINKINDLNIHHTSDKSDKIFYEYQKDWTKWKTKYQFRVYGLLVISMYIAIAIFCAIMYFIT